MKPFVTNSLHKAAFVVSFGHPCVVHKFGEVNPKNIGKEGCEFKFDRNVQTENLFDLYDGRIPDSRPLQEPVLLFRAKKLLHDAMATLRDDPLKKPVIVQVEKRD